MLLALGSSGVQFKIKGVVLGLNLWVQLAQQEVQIVKHAPHFQKRVENKLIINHKLFLLLIACQIDEQKIIGCFYNFLPFLVCLTCLIRKVP